MTRGWMEKLQSATVSDIYDVFVAHLIQSTGGHQLHVVTRQLELLNVFSSLILEEGYPA